MKPLQFIMFLLILFTFPALLVLFTTWFYSLMSQWDLLELRGTLSEFPIFWMFYIFLGHSISASIALYAKEEIWKIKS